MQTNWSDKILAECIGEELPPCQAACPLDIRVREKVALMQQGDMTGALAVLMERCPFPGILGRICHHPCEAACTRNQVEGAIAVAALKRYVADLDPGAALRAQSGPPRQERVAVVGGGPAGLMCAYELRLLGYPVTIFEAEGALGGALRWYLPSYRLPREVLDREVALVAHMGAEVRLNTRVGQDISWPALRRDFPAIFLALGAHLSRSLSAPGEDLGGVTDALSFLRAANTGEPLNMGRQIAVIGGGNVAVDAARLAHRLGAGQVTVICLESPDEMPALPAEIAAAREEGIDFQHRWGVKEMLGENHQVAGLRLMAVTRVFDDEGRFAPSYDETRLAEVAANQVIVAVGQEAVCDFLSDDLPGAEGLPGRLEADPETLATPIPGVFAGGDLVTGPKSAVKAFAAGRRGALAIHAYLAGEPLPAVLPPLKSRSTGLIVNLEGVSPSPREPLSRLSTEERLSRPQAEVELGLSPEASAREAARCLECTCSECVKNCTYLQAYVTRYPPTEMELVRLLAARGETEPRIPYSCHFCGLCRAVCPQDLHAGWSCLEVRRNLVVKGIGPLTEHRGIQSYARWGTSPTFTLSRPDPATGWARRAFFPGCSLPGYTPHLVKGAYDYLRSRLPDTGIILNCCGAPSLLTGEEAHFQAILDRVAMEMEKIGATELITACTHCLEAFRDYRRPALPARSLYEVLLEEGLPTDLPKVPIAAFHVHDACGARFVPDIHSAVRRLLTGLGHNLVELPHHGDTSICCGAGGMAPAVDAALARKMTDFRLSEATLDLVTYCATCRAVFARAGRPSLHLLELIFNPHWMKARTAAPAGSPRRWWNRFWLKRHFQNL